MPSKELDRSLSGNSTLTTFLGHFSLAENQSAASLLSQVIQVFSQIPYENLTKILKQASEGKGSAARRGPAEVISDYIAFGTGGTCFSLNAALLHLVRSLGFKAEPILADRPYGPNTHCAMLVWLNGAPHLVDPGYLITTPIILQGQHEQRLSTTFHEILLRPLSGGDRLELHTINQNQSKHRITFKTAPVDQGDFLKAWDASFNWDMMKYPVLTRLAKGKHVYLQGNRLQVRGKGRVERFEIAPTNLADQIAQTFGIHSRLVGRALAVLKRQGESHGQAAIS